LYNRWFLRFAPAAFRAERATATGGVLAAFAQTSDLTDLSETVLSGDPRVVAVLRMCCAPPIARDRLAGLAGVANTPIKALEAGRLPRNAATVLTGVAGTLRPLIDDDLFPWLSGAAAATEVERTRAASVVADRLCGARSDPIIRNAQEARQIALLSEWLVKRGYVQQQPASTVALTDMTPGTFAVRLIVRTGTDTMVNVPVDVVVQPKSPRPTRLPVLFELKSAGDFANVNKRRKEEAKKMSQLKDHLGSAVEYVLLLCGYFNASYLGYEAAEGIDWVWEHRMDDLNDLGL
jgi:hypothetical protein